MRVARIPRPLLGGVLLFLVLVAIVIATAPRVTLVNPEPGSTNVPSTMALQLVFTHEMDARSVEDRLSIDPSVPGAIIWEGRSLTFRPTEPWQEGSTVTVRLESGASTKGLIPTLRSYSWSFEIGERHILYLWPEGEPADLYMLGLNESEPVRLTETERGILDYSLSPNATRVVYSVELESGSSELRQLNLSDGKDRQLYACPQQVRCQAIAHAADGSVIAFERFEYFTGHGGQSFPGPSRVWALEVEPDAEAFPIGNADHISTTPQWSPAGWLAFYDDTLKAIAIVDVELGPEPEPFDFIPNDLDLSGAWSPDGHGFVYTAIVLLEADPTEVAYYSHLYHVDIDSGEVVDLSGRESGVVEDAAPCYSPDGEWIAFTRKYLTEESWSLGRQLWIMRSDGTDARQLTETPNLHVSAVMWGPEGEKLVFVRKNQADLTQPIEIWLIDVYGEEEELLVEGGYAPQWIP